jgi:integration host factor subunit alpha
MLALAKDELIAHRQTQIGMAKPESRQRVERLFKIMQGVLADGENLRISGFGTLLSRQKNAPQGRDPQTKEALMLKAREVVVFKTSGVLRDRINRQSDMPFLANVIWCR